MSEDYILIGGGLLIALVIMHGLWLAWRARQDPLPLDISSEIPDDGFDADELGPDFPNGGARVAGSGELALPTQRNLALEGAAPVLMDIVPEEAAISADDADASTNFDRSTHPPTGEMPDLSYASSAGEAPPAEGAGEDERIPPTERSERNTPAGGPSHANNGSTDFDGDWQGSRKEPIVPRAGDSVVAARTSHGSRHEERPARRERETARPDAGTDRDEHEILAINVLARGNSRFSGSELWAAFQRNGLTFGDMNIFHRLNPVTRTPQFSVANAVEPGTFDLSGMDSMKTLGGLPVPAPAGSFGACRRVR